MYGLFIAKLAMAAGSPKKCKKTKEEKSVELETKPSKLVDRKTTDDLVSNTNNNNNVKENQNDGCETEVSRRDASADAVKPVDKVSS